MNPTFFDASGRDVSLFILGLLLRASLLLAAALVCESLLRARGYSLIRASCWNGVLAALVMLPLTIWAVPPLRLPWLPGSRTQAMFDKVSPLATEAPPAFEFAFDAPEPAAFVREPSSAGPVSAAVAKTQERAAGRALLPVIPAVYALGTVLLLLRLAWSARKAGRLVRGAQSSVGEDWVRSCARCRSLLGVRPPVRLCACEEVRVPVALGWLSPHVLIPRQLAATATAAQRESILLHELAHIRRNDYAWQLLLHVVQALYWPNPLIWLVGRRISQAREQVCDEVCTHYATSPGDYRDTLLHVAAMLVRRPALALGICMARTPQLADRLHRIAQGRRSAACVARPSLRVAIGTLTLVAIGMLGALTFVRAAAAGAEVGAVPPPPETEQPSPPERGRVSFSLMPRVRVLDAETNQPIMGAMVTASFDGRETPEAPTSEFGRTTFERLASEPQMISVVARAEGYAPARVTWNKPSGIYRWPMFFDVPLQRGSPQRKPRDIQGQLDDATAWARSERTGQILDRRIEGYMNGPIPDLYDLSPMQRERMRARLEELKDEQLKIWRDTAARRAELFEKSRREGFAGSRSEVMAMNRASPLINQDNVLKEIEKLLPPEQAKAGRHRYETHQEELRSRPVEVPFALFMLAAGEGGQRMLEEGDGWARFVERFCDTLQLTDDQRATARSVLREQAAQRDEYMARHQQAIDKAIEAQDLAGRELFQPLEPIWDELRNRLDTIPTAEQMAMMKKRRPQQPATAPTDYISMRRPVRSQPADPPTTRPTTRPDLHELARRFGGIVVDDPGYPGGQRLDTGGVYQISGSVRNPGRYTIEPGQRLLLSQAIEAAGGIDAGSAGLQARITRSRSGQESSTDHEIASVLDGLADDPQVAAGDRILILPPR